MVRKKINISSVDDIKNNDWKLYDSRKLEIGKIDKDNLLILYYPKGTYIEESDSLFVISFLDNTTSNNMALTLISKFCKSKSIILQVADTSNKYLINEIRDEWKRKSTQENLQEADTTEIKKAEDVVAKAIALNASDIHIEKREDSSKAKLRYRVNGILTTYDYMYGHEATKMARIFYQIFTAKGGESGKTFDERSFLNGLFDREFNGKRVRVRISVFPVAPNGFDMVLRLLPYHADGQYQEISQLGYSIKDQQNITYMSSDYKGVTIIAGTTGSGKSTTLKNLIIKYIRDNENNIKAITIEDPPEYFIPNASQVPVNRENSKDNGKTEFGSAINQAMRSDPDFLMIGEIRDNLTANLTVKATQSGHKVLTTLHAPSAFGILDRLIDLGVSSRVLSSPDFISGLVYQKLLPVVCDKCCTSIINNKIPRRVNYEFILQDRFNDYSVDLDVVRNIKRKVEGDNENLLDQLVMKGLINYNQAEEIRELHEQLNNDDKNNQMLQRLNTHCKEDIANIRFKGKGCRHCTNGITGRTVVAETILPDLNFYRLISENKMIEAQQYWLSDLDGKTVKEDAMDRMKQGLIDPFDLERNLNMIGMK
jgi:type II secretory ATPase GspE/PulE/Tfp pilus assembly ATPase PilB-like protein